jgi:hypothetical protein
VQEEWYLRERIKKEGSTAGTDDFWENLPFDEMLEVFAYADVCCALADVCYAHAAVVRNASGVCVC